MIQSKYTNNIKIQYLVPTRIVSSSKADNTSHLLSDTPPQAVLGNTNVCRISEGGYVLLDIGAEICGGIEITSMRAENFPPLFRLVFGESVSEAMSDIGVKNATNDHSPRDFTFRGAGFSNLRLGQTGFRFVRIEVLEGDMNISGVRGASELRDIEYKGTFECDDELLNQIWHTAARTVHLNMQNYLWDGIKRDRLVWIGDMHAEVSAIMGIFGYNDVVEKSLDLIKEYTPTDKWMNNIPSYSFWWLIIRHDWYMYTGNSEYVIKDGKYICDMTSHILDSVSDDGTDNFTSVMQNEDENNPYMNYFIDWETLGTPDSKSGFYAVAIIALNACRTLCEVIGDKTLAAKCANKIEKIRSFDLPDIYEKQAAALAVLADMKDAGEINEKILSREPVADITAYLGYYLLLAKAKAGDVAGAIDIIKLYWGRMIELGATSFWESFNYPSSFDAAPIDDFVPDGKKDIHGDFGAYCYKGFRCSLCHGWACGPAPFITKCVLGVEILEPGCKRVRVKPNPGNLRFIKGTYPTPYGNIEIYAEKKNGEVVTDIKAPDGVIVER